MGATIAAHLANAGLDVLLLDMVPKELNAEEQAAGLSLESPQVRNRIAAAGLAGLMKMKPAPFYLSKYATQIVVGNFDDDLPKLQECDWVVEVVIEHLPIKLGLFEKIVPHLKPGAVLTTNTSGLSVNAMAEALPVEVRRNFMVTHFFNPPRYMRLLEIVPCKETDPAVVNEYGRIHQPSARQGHRRTPRTPPTSSPTASVSTPSTRGCSTWSRWG